MTKFAVACVIATALTASAALAAGATSPDRALRALVSRYDAHVLADRPDLASAYGMTRADADLAPVTEATLERDAALLHALGDSLAALDEAALAPRERVVRDTLAARLAREAAMLEAGTWRHDPCAYLALVHDAVLLVANRPHVSPCERARRALLRLRAVPEVLRSAEVNLNGAPAFDREAALARWDAALLDLRTVLPTRFEECREPERVADFVEADSLALAAARRFVRFVRER